MSDEAHEAELIDAYFDSIDGLNEAASREYIERHSLREFVIDCSIAHNHDAHLSGSQTCSGCALIHHAQASAAR